MVCGVMAEQRQIQFSEATLKEYHEVLGRYPTRQAALLPTLWMAQREFGWISNEVEDYVARLMELPAAHVRAVVSFYTMFYRQPMGRWHLEVCTNLPCRLRGAEQIVDCISRKLNIGDGQTTADGKFSLNEVECLASCGTAPMLQLNHGPFYENLTPDTVAQLVDELAKRGD
jgi:NADH-quinone oxidoreductase E subunit